VLKPLIVLYLSFSTLALECGQNFFHERGIETFLNLAPPKVSECANSIIEKATGEKSLIQEYKFKSDDLMIDEFAYSTDANENYFSTLEDIDPTFSSNVHCGCKSSSKVEKEQYKILDPITAPVRKDYKEYLQNIYSAKLKQTLKDVMELTLNRKRLEDEDSDIVKKFIKSCSIAKLKDEFDDIKRKNICDNADFDKVLPKQFLDNFSKANRNVPEENTCLGYKTQQMLTNAANVEIYSANIINNGQIYDEFTAMNSNMLLVPKREKSRYLNNIGYENDLTNNLDHSIASRQDAMTSSIYTRSLAGDLENHEKIFDEVYDRDTPKYDILLHDSTNLGVKVSQEIEDIVLSKIDITTGEASIKQVTNAVNSSISEYLESKPEYKEIIINGKQHHSLGGDNLKFLNEKVNNSILEKYEDNLDNLASRSNEEEGGPLSNKIRRISEMGDRFQTKYDVDKLREKKVQEGLIEYLNDKDRVFSSHLDKTIKNCEALAKPETIREFMCPFKEGKKELFLMTAFPPSDELNILTAESSCEEKSIHDDFGFGDEGIATSNNLDEKLLNKLKLFDPRTNIYNPNVLENSLNQRNIVTEVACKDIKCVQKNGAKVCDVTQEQLLKNLEEQINENIAKIKNASDCVEESYTIGSSNARECSAIDTLIKDGVKNEDALKVVSESLLLYGEKDKGDLFKLISAYKQIKSNTIEDVFQSSPQIASSSNTPSSESSLSVSEVFTVTDSKDASVASLIATGSNNDVENLVQTISTSSNQGSNSTLFTTFTPQDNITHTGSTFSASSVEDTGSRQNVQTLVSSTTDPINTISTSQSNETNDRNDNTNVNEISSYRNNDTSYSLEEPQKTRDLNTDINSTKKGNSDSSTTSNEAPWMQDTPKVSTKELETQRSNKNDKNAQKLAELNESLRKLEEQADQIERDKNNIRRNNSSRGSNNSSASNNSSNTNNTTNGIGNSLDRANDVANQLGNSQSTNGWGDDTSSSDWDNANNVTQSDDQYGQDEKKQEESLEKKPDSDKTHKTANSSTNSTIENDDGIVASAGGASSSGATGSGNSSSKKAKRGPASTSGGEEIKDLEFNDLEFQFVVYHDEFQKDDGKQDILENFNIIGKDIITLEEKVGKNGRAEYIKRVYKVSPSVKLLELLQIEIFEMREHRIEFIEKISKINLKIDNKKSKTDYKILDLARNSYKLVSKTKLSDAQGLSYGRKLFTGVVYNKSINLKLKGIDPKKYYENLVADQ